MVSLLLANFIEFIQNQPLIIAGICIIGGLLIIGGYILLKKYQDKKYREENGLPIEKKKKRR